MELSLFCGPLDLAGEGVDAVLDNVVTRAGVSRLAPAVAYHAARDVLPHNPLRRVATGGAGVCFTPEPGLYQGLALRPRRSEFARGRDLLAELAERAPAHGATVDAWTVYLHDDGDDEARPGVVRNLFGDPYPHVLCPSDPEVRAYAVALTRDVCRYPVGTVLAEAAHWLPFEHGHGHERHAVPLDATARLLLGLCFCAHCRAAAGSRGVPVPDLLDAARAHVEACLAGRPPGPPPPPLAEPLDGYLEARCDTVSALLAELAAEAARAGAGFRLLDLSAGLLGWADGRPEGEPGVHGARALGVRPGDLTCPVTVTAYARDPERVRLEVEAYRSLTRGPVGVALRPMDPDCDSADNLAQKLRAAAADRVDLYHYGLSPLASLDLIRRARAIAAS
ncbi:hypothetical protein AB0L44_14560 [Nonomuraea wenchangensis]|uniref:hypothetical protein n=1 Tax=Nonomuraea wenchangensis TaxID=568860 RepID=UPI003430FB30